MPYNDPRWTRAREAGVVPPLEFVKVEKLSHCLELRFNEFINTIRTDLKGKSQLW